ncbi:MAG: 6-pyruvoyl trahydropterin synthase family protein [Phycisphaerae bacterium]
MPRMLESALGTVNPSPAINPGQQIAGNQWREEIDVYSIDVNDSFNATHRVKLPDGEWEPLHGHDWHVTAHFRTEILDTNGMVVDFLEAGEALRSILNAWNHADLNQHPDFADAPPTAEIVARRILEKLEERGLQQIARVSVVEAPGCTATFEKTG